MGRAKSGTTDLEATRESLARWRRQYGGRGRRIPAVFWNEARELARAHGVEETARSLRLDPGRLADVVDQSKAITATSPQLTGFVELGGLEVGVARDAAVVEFVAREGDRVRVEVAASALDLVALARAFWSRRP